MSSVAPHPGFFRRHRNLLTGLLLAVLAWIIYLPSAQYDFVYYDDIRVLKDHPELYGQPSLAADLKAIFVTSFPREEPLLFRDVTWALDARLFGFNSSFGYHFGNVLLHGVVVALMFAFLLGSTRRYGFALATAAAYLLLAVHVEPVAWIMGRKDILSALFMLLALCAQTRRLTAKSLTAQSAWYAATLFCFVVGLLSKISVLTFPLVLFLHAVLLPWLRGERPPSAALLWRRELFREGMLLVPGLVVSGIIYVWYQRTLAQMGIFDRGYTAHGLAHLWNLLMVNPLGFWLYLKQVFLPSQLAVLYAWPTLPPAFSPWQIALGLATVAGALVAGLWLFCRRKDWFFYYAVFFVLMIPYLNLIYIGIWVADRYVYFASFCVLAIAVSVTGTLWQHSQRSLRLGILLIAGGLAANNLYQTVSYQPAWRNGATLWQYHIALPRHTAVAYENLAAYYYAEFGAALTRQDNPGMVAALHKMSVVVEAGLTEYWPDRQQTPPPQTSFLFFLKSLIEEVKGEPDAALASLLMSDRLHPRFDSTNLNLSRLYQKLSKTTSNPQRRETYLLSARDRFAEYIKLVYRGRQPPPGVSAEMAGLEAECAALASHIQPPPLKN
jgi:hypothetical protein